MYAGGIPVIFASNITKMQLSNNKILITGATSGIGKAMAAQFCKLGNQVIAVGRNGEKLALLAREYPQILPFQCDISSQTALDRLVMFIEQEHPDLNVLINNAGIQYNYHFADEAHAVYKIEKEISTNLTAPLKLIALLLPVLQHQEHPAIVNVSSGLGLVPKSQAPVYCGTKAGIHIFSRSLRTQLEKIKVFEIIPPLVDTAMTEGRGKGKISPQQLVDEFMVAFSRDKYEVYIGKTKWLQLINRIAPLLAHHIIKKGSESNR